MCLYFFHSGYKASILFHRLYKLMAVLFAVCRCALTVPVVLLSFPSQVQMGLLEVISPSAYYYPDFSSLTESLGDPKDRVKYVLH